MRTRIEAFIGRYRGDLPFRGRVCLFNSAVFNACYALFKLGFGVYYRSFWFGAVAVYYLVLAIMRAFLLGACHHVGNDLTREYRASRVCGWLLFALNLALSAVTVQMVADGKGYRYPGCLIYVAAMYAFYSVTMAIINLVRFRALKSPVLSASKVLGLASALVSMFSLQTAMFASFGGEYQFRRLANGLMGAGVCLLIFAMAILMVVWANRKLSAEKEHAYGRTK